MPAIADLPPQIVCVRPADDSFGDEAIFVSEAAAKAARHWEDRAGYILSQSSLDDELGYGYESVPLKRVGTVTVRCNFVGPLKPMPYEWDE